MKLRQITELMEGFKEAQVEFAKYVSGEEVKDLLNRYREVVKQNRAKGDERNIDYWRKQGFEKFSEFVKNAEQAVSKRSIKRQSKDVGKAIILKETERWLIVVPLDKSASCFYGKDTAWCTTKPFANYYEQYFYERGVTLIYFLNKETGGKWAIACHSAVSQCEYFDQEDNSISEDEFNSQTGINSAKVVDYAREKEPQINNAREKYKDIVDNLSNRLRKGEVSPEIEKDLIYTKNLKMIAGYLNYALDSGNVSPALVKLAGQITRDSMFASLPSPPTSEEQHSIFKIEKFPENIKIDIANQVANRAGTEEVLNKIISEMGNDEYPGGQYLTASAYNKLNSLGADIPVEDLLMNGRMGTMFNFVDFELPTDQVIDLMNDAKTKNDIESGKLMRGIASYVSSRPDDFDPKVIGEIYSFANRTFNASLFIDKLENAVSRTKDVAVIDDVAARLLKSKSAGTWYRNDTTLASAVLGNAVSSESKNAKSLFPMVFPYVAQSGGRLKNLVDKFLTPESIVELTRNTEDPIEFLVSIAKHIPEMLSKDTALAALKNAGEDFDEVYNGTFTTAGKRFLKPLTDIIYSNEGSKDKEDFVGMIKSGEDSALGDPSEIIQKSNNDPAVIAAYAGHGIFPQSVNYTPELLRKIVDSANEDIQVVMIGSKFRDIVDADQVGRKLAELGHPAANQFADAIKKAQQKDTVTEIKRLAGLS